MAKETIRATIKKDGTISITVEGIAGKSCVEATKEIELFLGKQRGNQELTADYYKPEPKGPEAWITRG